MPCCGLSVRRDGIGIRAIQINAISDGAMRVYEKYGFGVSPLQPMTLMAALPNLVAGSGILQLPATGL